MIEHHASLHVLNDSIVGDHLQQPLCSIYPYSQLPEISGISASRASQRKRASEHSLEVQQFWRFPAVIRLTNPNAGCRALCISVWWIYGNPAISIEEQSDELLLCGAKGAVHGESSLLSLLSSFL
jgi:hypothetical protein